jgi:peroxiredoxin
MSLTFDALRFKKKIQKTLAHLKQILDNNKNVVLVEDRKHSYEDKYQLCEFVTNLSLASQLTCFVNLGVSPDNIKLLRSWARFHAISFRFTVEERLTI